MKLHINEFFMMNQNWNAVISLDGSSIPNDVYILTKREDGFWEFPYRPFLTFEERVALDQILDASVSNIKMSA